MSYCVYFISDGIGHCKIGVAECVEQRILSLQTGNANELTVKRKMILNNKYEARALESRLHKNLEPARVLGEWFDEKAVDEYLARADAGIESGKDIPATAERWAEIVRMTDSYFRLMDCRSLEEAKNEWRRSGGEEMPNDILNFLKKHGGASVQEEADCELLMREMLKNEKYRIEYMKRTGIRRIRNRIRRVML